MKEGVEDIEIDVQIPVHHDVSEACDAPKLPGKLVGQHTEASEFVDRAGVVRHIAATAGCDVGRDVERILGAQLEAAFHHPTFFGIGVEVFEGDAAAGGKHSERFSESGEMPSDDLNVDFAGVHSERSWAAGRLLRMASILASCGAKSQ